MMSAARVTQVALHSLMIRWHPADWAEVTGPGTAISGLPRSAACRAVFRAPPRSPAPTITVAQARAAVGGGVDAVRPDRDDSPAPLPQVGRHFAGDVRAVAGGGPRAHHRHGTR